MSAPWTAPETGSYHFPKAGETPHPFGNCEQCRGQERTGWIAWFAKGAVADLDDDPNQDPGRLPRRG